MCMVYDGQSKNSNINVRPISCLFLIGAFNDFVNWYRKVFESVLGEVFQKTLVVGVFYKDTASCKGLLQEPKLVLLCGSEIML